MSLLNRERHVDFTASLLQIRPALYEAQDRAKQAKSEYPAILIRTEMSCKNGILRNREQRARRRG
jgi:hypothetical protein